MITQTQAIHLLNYLIDAQAVTPTETIAATWSDYLTAADVEALEYSELLPAVRATIQDWNRAGRTYRVNPDMVVQAVKRIRRENVQRCNAHLLTPDGDLSPDGEVAWRRAVIVEAGKCGDATAAVAKANKTLNALPQHHRKGI